MVRIVTAATCLIRPGSDGVDDDERMYQCFLYMKHPDHTKLPDENYYAQPLPISPVISAVTQKVIRVELMPTGPDEKIKPFEPYKVRPSNQYLAEHQTLRKDVKPLHVVQPEGVGFKVTEGLGVSTIEWQKWHMKVVFNQREGMVLYDVS
jgi:primary-amine oxidase